VQQNDQRPLTGLDVVQALVADVRIALLKLDSDIRKHAGGGHEDLPCR